MNVEANSHAAAAAELAALVEEEQKLNDKDDQQLASQLIDKMNKMHASLLFEKEGWQALKEICLGISAIPNHSSTKGWRDLAAELQLSFYEIGCISNYTHDDYTELLVKTYAQDETATIDKIIRSVLKIDRADVIHRAYVSLEKLYTAIVQRLVGPRQHCRSSDADDGSYQTYRHLQSDALEKIRKGPLIKARNLTSLFATLPITLKNADKLRRLYGAADDGLSDLSRHGNGTSSNVISTARDNNDYIIYKEVYHKDIVKCENIEPRRKLHKCEKVVMLTYASGGAEYVDEIALQFRTPKAGKLPIGVLTLNEHKMKVLENPEAFIMSVFPQVDYVVPILTPDYFQSLSLYSPKINNNNALSKYCSLDENYTSLIHDLICKHYVRNQCRNDKVRCIIPDPCISLVTNHPQFFNDPTLKVWLALSELDTLVNVMLTQ